MLLRLTVGLLAVMGAVLFAVDDDGMTRTDLAALRVEQQRAVQLDLLRAPVPPVADGAGAPAQDDGTAPAQEPPPPEGRSATERPEGETVSAAEGETATAPAPEADPPAAQPDPPAASADPDPAQVVLTVTGSRVNVRAGPSTQDEVIAQVVEGERVELLDMLPDGWARIRVEGVAQDVYMSASFLSETP